MQLFSLLSYPSAKLNGLTLDSFSQLFSAALSHRANQKDLLSREKDHEMILHYRKQINQIESTLITLRMHPHYQTYQSDIASLNMQFQKVA